MKLKQIDAGGHVEGEFFILDISDEEKVINKLAGHIIIGFLDVHVEQGIGQSCIIFDPAHIDMEGYWSYDGQYSIHNGDRLEIFDKVTGDVVFDTVLEKNVVATMLMEFPFLYPNLDNNWFFNNYPARLTLGETGRSWKQIVQR